MSSAETIIGLGTPTTRPGTADTVLETNRRQVLEDEIVRDEAAFEMYGGDDVHEPSPKTNTPTKPSSPAALKNESHATIASPLPPTKEDEKADPDPNMVTWDGPDDPTNPQNWSTGYKWFITIVCGIMTINV